MSHRFGALFPILLPLFEPILRHLQRDQQSPLLASGVDDSQFLSLDTETENAPDLRSITRATVEALPRARLSGDAQLFAFSNEVQRLASPDSLRFEGSRTNITQALDYARDELADDNLRGVLLISDGQ